MTMHFFATDDSGSGATEKVEEENDNAHEIKADDELH
jgi:hypothetical protein